MKEDRHEQFADWITRFYASHDDIPDGHSDGELIGKLIRCKDCRYYSRGTIEGKHLCMSVKYRFAPTTEDEWCSRAERKEE